MAEESIKPVVWYLSHINWISGAFFIVALGLFFWRRCRGKSAEAMQKEMYPLLVTSGSAAQMPVGIALFIGAFDTRLLAYMGEVTMPLLFAGATVLLIGAIEIAKAW